MGVQVNQALLTDDPSSVSALPEGVYKTADYPEGQALPEGWVELLRVNEKVYGIRKHVNPRVAFRMLRAIRKGGSVEAAMADLMYDVLGDAVMDVLADENLDETEFTAVMKAVNKHTQGALAALGN